MDRRTFRASATAALLVVAIAGCATGASLDAPATASIAATAVVTPAPTPSTTPTPTPTPEATPDLAALGAAYLAISDRVREESFRLNDETPTTDAAAKKHYGEYATLFTEVEPLYAAIEVPAAAQPAMTDLLAAIVLLKEEYTILADDPSYDPGSKISDAAVAVRDAGIKIREVLGLPPPPTLPPE